jgi:prepilin-type N-terminal cleavage/methylation domain-containing protein
MLLCTRYNMIIHDTASISYVRSCQKCFIGVCVDRWLRARRPNSQTSNHSKGEYDLSFKGTTRKGFTLVELIVVIAILAILTGVLIPSFSRFVDDGRFSNDVQRAASMSKVVNAYMIGNPDEVNTAYDVREILNTHEGTEVDFTPQAKNTGFFYLSGSKTVVALKYDDAEDYVDSELSVNDIVLMNHVELDGSSFESPEELFGAGKHLLSTDGSPVAQAVDFIYSLAETGGQVETYYELGIETFEQLDASLWVEIVNFFTYNLSDEMIDKIKDLLDHYNPATTLYVNNLDWMTTGKTAGAVDKVVFAQGISNIPPFAVGVADNVFDLPNKIILPKTVKTVESGAFTAAALAFKDISYAGQGTLKVEEGALPDGKDLPSVVLSRSAIEGSVGMVTYEEVDTDINVDINALNEFLKELDVTVKSYKIELTFDGDTISAKVSIYTEEGYYGFIDVEEKQT